ncbi:MAG: sigma-70 family RNA polymerase sigma factor [Flavobacteriales bacterium]|nr:sigma-70 family RNA polymerase sigma factor [Flavobacteriales bacterium]
MKDQDIVKLIRNHQESKAFTRLYKYERVVTKLIKSKGGSKEDAQDIYQEALIVFYEKCQNPDFNLTASIDSYLYSISRFLWKNQQRKKGISFADSELEESEQELSDYWEEETKSRMAEAAIAKLKEQCQKILQLFYLEAKSMTDILKIMSFKTADVAKTQKYRCLEKARAYYQELSNPQNV